MELLSTLNKAAQRKFFSAINLSDQSPVSTPAPTRTRVGGGSFSRSASEHSFLGALPVDSSKTKQLAENLPPLGPTSIGRTRLDSRELQRSTSLVDITMKEYLDNIAQSSTTNDDEDDEGVFF
jgi:hypothetical protein